MGFSEHINIILNWIALSVSLNVQAMIAMGFFIFYFYLKLNPYKSLAHQHVQTVRKTLHILKRIWSGRQSECLPVSEHGMPKNWHTK